MRSFHRIAWPMAAAAVFASVPAVAQEARDTHFNGLYVGVAGGATMQNNDGNGQLRFDRDGDGQFNDQVLTTAGTTAFSPGYCRGAAQTATPAGGCDKGPSNTFDYAARIGYDARLGRNIVAGVLVEANKNSARQSVSGFSTTPASYTLTRKLDYGLAARGRIGFTPNGGFLLYGTGGVTYSKLKHDFSTTNTANTFDERRNGKMVWGWQAGGGGEIMVTNNVSLGLEYLYSRYRDDKYQVDVGQGTAPITNPFVLGGGGTSIRPSEKNFNIQAVRASLNLQF